MRPQLLAHALRQHGLVTRLQALQSGYTEGDVRAQTRTTGSWHTVRRGVYVERALWSQLDRDERGRREIFAVLLLAQQPLYSSHGSSALIAALPMLESSRALIHMTAPRINGGRTEHGVKYHSATIEEMDTVRTPFGPATGLARTVCDIAREDGYLPGLVVADAALRRDVERADLERVAAGMKHWPGVTNVRAVVRDADRGAENPGETLFRAVLARLGWGAPRLQVAIREGGRSAYVDAMLGAHAFEFDGRVKYARSRPYADGRLPEDVLFEEKRREDWLRAQSEVEGLSRATWDEVWTEVWRTDEGPLLRRLRADVEATIKRIGLPAWMASLGGALRPADR